jgi:hypothetical protein
MIMQENRTDLNRPSLLLLAYTLGTLESKLEAQVTEWCQHMSMQSVGVLVVHMLGAGGKAEIG